MGKKVHFLGITGSGASAAAAIAQSQSFEVTGCDLEPNNEFTTQFSSEQLLKGHSASHLTSGNVDILAVTPAIFSLDPNNPELITAKKKGIPVLTWQQFMGKFLVKNHFVIAVCGTHGKTTTTAMIAKLLEDAGLDPTVELGGIVPRWKTNFRIGKGKYFVVEADEFNDNFLHLKPDIAVVTSIEMDHPEYFKDFESVKDSFKKFLLQTKTSVVANLTNQGVAEVVKTAMKAPVVQNVSDRKQNVQYLDYSKNEPGLNLKIPGKFNQLNSAAAFKVGLLLNIDPSVIKQSLESYTGVSRRFEYIGKFKGAEVYSDFGHHPTEIKVTMQAARQKFPKQRILLIYQPHMFSRTKALFTEFVKTFQSLPVDKTFLVDIYPSREKDTGLVNSKQLVDATAKGSVIYIGSIDETLKKLKPQIKPNDIVFFMGAGSIDKLARELVKKEKYCTIYIVRHGQTDWNAQGIIQGETDIPLNSEGIEQAKVLSKDLKDVRFDAIFSSDLIRAKRTAEIIALEKKLAIKTTQILRERRYGKFEGTPGAEMGKFHKIWEGLSKKERLTFKPFEGYETDEEAIARFITFLREVSVLYLGKVTLVVSHGGIIRALLNHLSEKTYFIGAISNSAYIKLESDGADFFIKELKGIKNPNE